MGISPCRPACSTYYADPLNMPTRDVMFLQKGTLLVAGVGMFRRG